MATFRKIVFYLFAAVYLVVCPALILYALGYLFTPGIRPGLVETGLLALGTVPPGASVTLGTAPQAEKTPTIVRDLLPGDYPVTLTLEGCQPWRRTVPVKAGKSTPLERILLLPKTWSRETLTADRFDELIPLPGIPFALLRKTGTAATAYFLFDLDSTTVRPLFALSSPFRTAKVTAIYTVNESPVFLMSLANRQGPRLLWIEPQAGAPRLEDLTPLCVEPPERLLWDPRQPQDLLAVQGGHVSRLDMEARTCAPRLLTDLRGIGLFRQRIYALKTDGMFLRTDMDGAGEELLLSDPALAELLFGKHRPYQVTVLSRDLVLFLGDHGELLTNRLPYRFVDGGVRGAAYDAARERLLFWQGSRIGVLDFSRVEPETRFFEQGPALTWVYRNGHDLRQASWVYEGSHVLFRDGDRVALLEVDTACGAPRLTPLCQVKGTGAILYVDATGRLYYLDHAGGRLCAMDILPRHPPLFPRTGRPPAPAPDRP